MRFLSRLRREIPRIFYHGSYNNMHDNNCPANPFWRAFHNHTSVGVSFRSVRGHRGRTHLYHRPNRRVA